ncbi:MAG: DUF3540 domain-containing protein [Deltaproteobacteria bacterium]|nr:DUF3540 domain-containing protein [Deltaproteobacteria bacterium]
MSARLQSALRAPADKPKKRALRVVDARPSAAEAEAALLVGTVEHAEGPAVRVRAERGLFDARRAPSCLVQPEPADRVLLCEVHAAGCYVLAVLEREGQGVTQLGVDGDLEIRVPDGRLGVAAQQGVELISGRELAVVAGRLNIDVGEGDLAVGKLSYFGQLVLAEADKVKLVCASLEAVLDRWVQRVKRSYRFVQESDQLRAGSIDHVAEGTVRLHGENALLTAEKLVKIDAEQIHIA